MSAPDPKGCERCGLVECEAFILLEEFSGGVDVTDEEAIRLGSASIACLKRPAVDWQAECRRRDERLAMATRYEMPGIGPLDIAIVRKRNGWWIENLPHIKSRGGLGLDNRGLRPFPTADAAFAALDAATKGQTDG